MAKGRAPSEESEGGTRAALVALVLAFFLSLALLLHSWAALGGGGLPKGPLKVCVTGANGQTGSIVVRKLSERKAAGEAVSVVGIVRSEKSKQQLLKQLPSVDASDVKVVPGYEKDALKEAMAGCDRLVILTSAKPKLVVSSLFGVMWNKYVMQKAGVKPSFYYQEGQEPKQVDWVCQKDQIDAAKDLGVKQVVLISSMGGTKPDHFLNTMGNGNILLWKRKAEKYLVESGLKYTIIHPGGLLPHYGMTKEGCDGGKRELLVETDDALLESDTRTIPREDVAEVTVQSLTTKEAIDTSWDLTSKKEGEGEVFTTLAKLLKTANKSLKTKYDQPQLPNE